MDYIRILILTSLSLLLIACGGSSDNEETEEIQGYWVSRDNDAHPAFEFFDSASPETSNSSVRTGRVKFPNQPAQNFYWSKNIQGFLFITVVNDFCPNTSITSCQPVASVEIRSVRASGGQQRWNVDYDYGNENTTDLEYQALYAKNAINLSNIADGDIYFTEQSNPVFLDPMLANKSSDTLRINLRVDEDETTEVTANITDIRDLSIIDFDFDDSFRATEEQTFPTFNGGEVDLDVQSRLLSVTLTASAMSSSDDGAAPNPSYILSWYVQRSIIYPEGIDRDNIDVSQLISRQRTNQSMEVFDDFIDGPQIAEGDVFFTHFPSDFTASDGFGNEVIFATSDTGIAAFASALDDTQREEHNFTWQQASDRSLDLFVNGSTSPLNIRFLAEINGGYRVLYSVPDTGEGMKYHIRDLVRQADPVLTGANLEGVYQVINITSKPSGTYVFDITFNDNGTLVGDLNGYWFENADGSIQSYDCRNLVGEIIDNYQSCLTAIEMNEVSFAWVRRVEFIHQQENRYQAKYNSFLANRDDPMGTEFAWTYRFTRVSDVD